MSSRRFRIGLCAALFVVSAGVMTVLGSTQANAYSNSQINAKLAGGTAQAYSWDQNCYSALRKRLQLGDGARAAINNAPSYRYKTWLAPQSSPSQTTPILIDYGQQSVPLQLHSIVFLCAALTTPNKGANFPNSSSYGVITSSSSANDRTPGSGTNYPAMTANRYRINSAQVIQGNGTLSPSLTGKTYANTYKTNTRYWFASPISFNYIPSDADGITDVEQTVKIAFKVTGVATFYTSDYACMNGQKTSAKPRTATDYSRCNEKTITLTIKFKLKDKYNLTPTVSVDDRTTEGTTESGAGMSVVSTVTQETGDTASAETDWRVTELRYAPGAKLSADDIKALSGSADPCAARPTADRTYCETFQRDANKIFDGTGDSKTYGYVTGDEPVGTRICFVASVSRPTQSDSPLWGHSPMVCSIIAKKPKVHIIGGDLLVGKGGLGDVQGSRSVRTVGGETEVFGSWGEYAVIASGLVTDFASGAGYSAGTKSTDFCDVSLLTFTNSGTSFCKDPVELPVQGRYNMDARTLPDVASRFSSSQGVTGGSLNVSTANGIYTDASSDTITVTSTDGAPVGKGKSVVLVAPKATVTIARDIHYTTAALGSIGDIPQVVIIANRIVIDSSVRNVDAWLVATGTTGSINTCSSVSDPNQDLNSDKCTRQLTVNGPVIARHLYLYRTANAGSASNAAQAAEIFNLRPDAYLWATNYAQQAGRVQTVLTKELPPRF